LRKLWHDMFTEDDGKSYCFAKVMSGVAFVGFHVYVVWEVLHGRTYGITDYASASMQVLLGCGGLIAGKQATQKPSV
jgi:hypothetical protein